LQRDDSQERCVLPYLPPHAAGQFRRLRAALQTHHLSTFGGRTLEHPAAGEPWEYQVLMEVRDEAGKVVSRQIIGVGALHRGEKRIFSLRVEMAPAPISN
jgi:hypothetical protein